MEFPNLTLRPAGNSRFVQGGDIPEERDLSDFVPENMHLSQTVSSSSLREDFSPAMKNTNRDQIERCIDSLYRNQGNMASLDARESLKDSLRVFIEHFSVVSCWEGEIVEAEFLLNLLDNPYSSIEEVEEQTTLLKNSLNRMKDNATPHSPNVSKFVRGRLKSIEEDDS